MADHAVVLCRLVDLRRGEMEDTPDGCIYPRRRGKLGRVLCHGHGMDHTGAHSRCYFAKSGYPGDGICSGGSSLSVDDHGEHTVGANALDGHGARAVVCGQCRLYFDWA